MALAKRYEPGQEEPRLAAAWQEAGIYQFDPGNDSPVFSIDTPPPTVSGNLHLGHTYSYSHPDFIARYRRMRGENVYYPMGFDDNGLPTERLVEKRQNITASQVGRQAFIDECLRVSEAVEQEYRQLWQRLGLSIDWRYMYRTIDAGSRRISQLSFIDLYKQGLVYRQSAPAIWCPECQTAIAQAELNDLERQTEFVNLAFQLPDRRTVLVATTRPELLPACVALFFHPGDPRYQELAGETARVPLFGQQVPILPDPGADPQKGTGLVMCCTFGDSADVAWQRSHNLPIIEALDRGGRLTAAAKEYSGLPAAEARRQIKDRLARESLLQGRQSAPQSVRVHERCDTPVEYVVAAQWFVRVLDDREALLAAGEKVSWQPETMKSRYQAWVENLSWDWCISRQRFFGVPFPVWYCTECRAVTLAEPDQLPVDPLTDKPARPCPQCGREAFTPDTDVFDTWATSSLTPQIAGRWLEEPALFQKVFPFSLRPQAHEIIRTWAFYTIVKSHYHFHALPWTSVLISGWGLAGEGMPKLSKSRGGGPMPPLEMIDRHSADAIRYWAASAGPGKDAIISEEKIQLGSKLVTKLWNVARFAERFLEGYLPPAQSPDLTPADSWILAEVQRLVRRVTVAMENMDYATAKSEVETFFWTRLTDNYLEMCKQRLYEAGNPRREGAMYSLYHTLLVTLKLLAPVLPFITDAIYTAMFSGTDGYQSIHISCWPEPVPFLEDPRAGETGDLLLAVASAVRRYKSERNLPLGAEFFKLQLATGDVQRRELLMSAKDDLKSITRAQEIAVYAALPGEGIILSQAGSPVQISILEGTPEGA